MDSQASDEGGAIVPAGVPQYFMPLRGATQPGSALVYQASVLAAATINFVSTKTGASTSSRIRRFAVAPETALALDWERATPLEATLEEMDRQSATGATLAPLPPAMGKVTSYRAWGNDFSDWAYRTQTMETLKSSAYRLSSDPGETAQDFLERVTEVAASKAEDAINKLEKKYESKKATLERRLMQAEHAREREAEQSRGRKIQTFISFGATVLRGVFGKATGAGTIGSATTAMRDVSRSIDQAGDVKRADQKIEAVKQKLEDLETQHQDDVDAVHENYDVSDDDLENVLMRPRKSDITIDALGLLWLPSWQDESGRTASAWQ